MFITTHRKSRKYLVVASLLALTTIAGVDYYKEKQVEATLAKLPKPNNYTYNTVVAKPETLIMNIKHYTCIDDGKTPKNPTYCITKDGTRLTENHLNANNRIVAVKPGRFPLGTWLMIEGIGVAKVADWGVLEDNELDLWVGFDNRAEAIKMGIKQDRKVQVLKW